jgi:diadenosine tetraphosphate (Ap4A) HIT family hydrolase
MATGRLPYAWPRTADYFFRLVEGREPAEIVHETEQTLVIDNPDKGGHHEHDVDLLVVPKTEVSSLAALDLSDAMRWVDAWEAATTAARGLGLGPGRGYRIDIPVHPPHQEAPWLTMRVRHKASKAPKPGADEHGWTRDIAHFAGVAEGRRRVAIVYENERVIVFTHTDEDDPEWEHSLVAIPRRRLESILDPEFTGEDWLALTAGFIGGAEAVGFDVYKIYLNVMPPYQHTPWVHAHVLCGHRPRAT